MEKQLRTVALRASEWQYLAEGAVSCVFAWCGDGSSAFVSTRPHRQPSVALLLQRGRVVRVGKSALELATDHNASLNQLIADGMVSCCAVRADMFEQL